MAALAPMLRALGVVAAATVLWIGTAQAQERPRDALFTALRQGGYLLVMRHASSPRDLPDERSANPDNLKRERQLDEAGRAGATAFGSALRALRIPVGEVLSSPTYRTLETVRLAALPPPRSHDELGEGGGDMQGVTESQAVWLRERAARFPTGTNTVIVTHSPNLARAFPAWGVVAEGEVVVIGPAGGAAQPVGRIKIDEWARLARQ
jgi:phosphohistidine phosphatase SixA